LENYQLEDQVVGQISLSWESGEYTRYSD